MKWNPTVRDKILAFVEDNPRCTSRQISHAIDLPDYRVTVEMASLKRRGHVVSEKVDNSRCHLYSLPDAYEGVSGKPRRITVKEWTGHKRDDWHKLFYGAATA